MGASIDSFMNAVAKTRFMKVGRANRDFIHDKIVTHSLTRTKITSDQLNNDNNNKKRHT